MSWQQTTLGEIADIVSGSTPRSGVPRYWDGAIAWATPTDLSRLDSKHLDKTDRTITEAGLNECSARLLPPGSVLFSSRAPIGLVAINTTPMATNQGFKSFVPRPEVNADYLYWWLRANRTQLEDLGNGATFKEVSKAVVSRVKFPLPPLTEQRRIAAILDKGHAICRKRKQVLTLADDFLRSMFLKMFGRPGQPNPSLLTDELGQMCDLFAGNSLPVGTNFNGQEHGLLLLKVGDMNLSGNEDVVQVAREWIDEGRVTGPAIRAPKDAIVFPKRGGAIATNKKRVLGRDCILDPNLMAVAPKAGSPISFQFLRAWFDLLDLSTLSNGSTVPQLNKGDLKPLELPIPRSNDLIAFDKVFENVARIRQRLADDLGMSESLFAALSQRAFAGDL